MLPGTWDVVSHTNIVNDIVIDNVILFPQTYDMSSYRPAGARHSPKSNQREATKRKLLEAARDLFAMQGFEETSVTQIAAQAGVSHSLINAYFDGKAGLLYAVMHEFHQSQIDRLAGPLALEGDTREKIRQIIGPWVEHELSDRPLLAVLQAYAWQWPPETEQQNREQLRAAFMPLRETLEDGIASGELRADLDISGTLYVVLAIFTQALRFSLHDNDPPETCLETVMTRIDIVLDGARAQA